MIEEHPELDEIKEDIIVFDINGPLFFGVAERTISSFKSYDNLHKKIIIFDMQDVISIDGTTISGLQSIKKQIFNRGQSIMFVGASTNIIYALKRAGLQKVKGKLTYCSDFEYARDISKKLLENM